MLHLRVSHIFCTRTAVFEFSIWGGRGSYKDVNILFPEMSFRLKVYDSSLLFSRNSFLGLMNRKEVIYVYCLSTIYRLITYGFSSKIILLIFLRIFR